MEAEENKLEFKEAQKVINNRDLDQYVVAPHLTYASFFLAYLAEQSRDEDIGAYKEYFAAQGCHLGT